MTTVTINVRDSDNARIIADALRLMKSVLSVSVSNDSEIDGLPHTRDAYMADIQQAENDYATQNVIPSGEMLNQIKSW